MPNKNQSYNLLTFLRAFFPLQLLVGQIKYNLIGVIYWLILFLIVTETIGTAFGIPLLFFSPEYLGEVSAWSFLFIGFSIGGFIMAFNTYSYVKLGPHYPFLTAVYRPFFRFCKNNSVLPLIFIAVYSIKMFRFQAVEELANSGTLATYILAFYSGILIFILLSIFYFFPTSKYYDSIDSSSSDSSEKPFESVIHKKKGTWYDYFKREDDRIYLYFARGFKLVKSRSIKHIDQDIIEKIFARNKINTSIFELLTIIAFITIGLFRDRMVFELPAGMSIILLMTIVLMLFSALSSWFGKWTYPLIGVLIFSMNYLSINSHYFNFKNFAYGLNYTVENRPEYSIASIEHMANIDRKDKKSYDQYIETLNNWKLQTGESRPKLIILNTSGGGSRSALWTFGVLQKLDEKLNGKIQHNLHLITGASGGMVGASYFRELILRSKKGEIKSPYNKEYYNNLGKDLLNKLAFSASTNDIFFRYQKFNYNGITYPKDRGYAFEEQLHENTNRVLDHPLSYYKTYEQSGSIPVMLFSPTIINDGRRLLISSQSFSFLTGDQGGPARMTKSYENIDYQTFFQNVKPGEIRFSSVLRANSTFPFVLPMVTMPTNPEMQLMDAGIRDNYGGKAMMEFLHVMQDWINENTSGVIVLQIRDTKKILNNEAYRQVSMIDKIMLPFGNMYSNFPRTQDFDQEELMKIGVQQFRFPVDLISFNLRENKKDRISLSWHLTLQEKIKIDNAFDSKLNQASYKQLKRLLGQ